MNVDILHHPLRHPQSRQDLSRDLRHVASSLTQPRTPCYWKNHQAQAFWIDSKSKLVNKKCFVFVFLLFCFFFVFVFRNLFRTRNSIVHAKMWRTKRGKVRVSSRYAQHLDTFPKKKVFLKSFMNWRFVSASTLLYAGVISFVVYAIFLLLSVTNVKAECAEELTFWCNFFTFSTRSKNRYAWHWPFFFGPMSRNWGTRVKLLGKKKSQTKKKRLKQNILTIKTFERYVSSNVEERKWERRWIRRGSHKEFQKVKKKNSKSEGNEHTNQSGENGEKINEELFNVCLRIE